MIEALGDIGGAAREDRQEREHSRFDLNRSNRDRLEGDLIETPTETCRLVVGD